MRKLASATRGPSRKLSKSSSHTLVMFSKSAAEPASMPYISGRDARAFLECSVHARTQLAFVERNARPVPFYHSGKREFCFLISSKAFLTGGALPAPTDLVTAADYSRVGDSSITLTTERTLHG